MVFDAAAVTGTTLPAPRVDRWHRWTPAAAPDLGAIFTVPMVDGQILQVRRAGQHDAQILRTIFLESRAEEFVDLPVELSGVLLNLQAAAHRADRLRTWPDSVDYLIGVRHVPNGRLSVAVTSTEIRIVDLLLLPGSRRQGIAAALIRSLAARARDTARTLCLTVPEVLMDRHFSADRWPVDGEITARVIDRSSAGVEVEFSR